MTYTSYGAAVDWAGSVTVWSSVPSSGTVSVPTVVVLSWFGPCSPMYSVFVPGDRFVAFRCTEYPVVDESAPHDGVTFIGTKLVAVAGAAGNANSASRIAATQQPAASTASGLRRRRTATSCSACRTRSRTRRRCRPSCPCSGTATVIVIESPGLKVSGAMKW